MPHSIELRRYFDPRVKPFFWNATSPMRPHGLFCEHCDRADMPLRHDPLRGDICADCDFAMDMMTDEQTGQR